MTPVPPTMLSNDLVLALGRAGEEGGDPYTATTRFADAVA